MNRLASFAFATALSVVPAAPAFAVDHLIPEASSLGDYHKLVRAVLKDAFDPAVRVRAIVEPSFQPEFAVGVREGSQGFSIFFVQPARQVWDYTMVQMLKGGEVRVQKPDGSSDNAEEIKRLEAELPADPTALKVSRCEVAVSPALAHGVIEGWKEMLNHIGPRDPSEVGVDGETYHFSLGEGGAEGQTWSPPQGSKPGMLVAVVYAMRDYCRGQKPERLAELERRSSALLETLHADPQAPVRRDY